ncbi:MAG: glycoside hydrolase family 3 C-terminal domain-containing protein [Acidobacteria bacterium]|nr:glycoside hydrolase family 3 C-terminal domain-containing protein [Acidobacteriota bacterium]
MAEHEKNFRAGVTRRDFLGSAVGSAALVAMGKKEAAGETVPATAEEKPEALDTGGIAIEHFENARKRAAALVAQMTLEEKISQFGSTGPVPAIPRLHVPAFKYYGGEALHGLSIGPVGPVTSFPLPLAMGCSWNRSLVERVFTAVSDEIWAWHKKNGLSQPMFSPPTVNMGARDPRWGRIAENYSEDPYLIGQMAIYTIHGMQGCDRRYLKAIACAKHFIGNDTEDDRYWTSATIDPRSFWEYYTRGFEACVREGHVFTVMSSYNAMNGIPTTASRFLLTDLLRERWGFRGYVVSDCDAVHGICHSHYFVPTYVEAAALAVNAGCDIDCGDTLQKYLGEAVGKMLVSESTLDHSLIRSYTGRFLLGEFDPPEQVPYSKIPISCLESPAHRQLAREAARQSIVLFKNEEHTLPLDKSRLKKLAVIGPMAAVCHLGNYSGKPDFLVSPLQGIKEYLGAAGGSTEVTYALGCSVIGEKQAAQFAEAVQAAREAEVALVFVGDDQQVDRESHDRISYIHLPGAQHELVQAVYAANPRTILVISSNCPVAVNWEQEHLPAIVGGMFLGEQQGNALADVLFGDYNPGGKLNTTWYRSLDNMPSFRDYNIRHGRTYMYFRGRPLYPFGHGLSYTTFRYGNLQLSGKTLAAGGKVTISLEVTNTGDREGDEVVQLYVHCEGSKVERPLKQLVNFERVHLKRGETRTVSFELAHADRALQYWDESKYEFVVEPGTVDILVGASSADIRLKGAVQLKG